MAYRLADGVWLDPGEPPASGGSGATALEPGGQVLVAVTSPDGMTATHLLDDQGRLHSTVGVVPGLTDTVSAGLLQPATLLRVGRRRRPWALAGRIVAWCVGLLLVAMIVVQWMGIVTLRTVLTASMKPTITPGSLVVAVSDNYRAPRLGDIVLYQGRRFDGTVVGTFAHRIIGGDATTGWIVKGDANPKPDTQRPTSVDIIAVVVWHSRGFGRFLRPQLLLTAMLVIVGLGLIARGLRRTE